MDRAPHSYLYSGNAEYIESLYEDWLEDPARVPEHWRRWFETVGREHPLRPEAVARALAQARVSVSPSAGLACAVPAAKQVAVLQLINAYRFLGHRRADLDPLKQYERPDVPELHLAYHGLEESDLDQEFNTGSLFGVPDRAPLREILAVLESTYCRTIGSEYMHITDTRQKRWIQKRLEGIHGRPRLDAAMRRRILERLTAGLELERYLHRKYVGQKRFSLEGGLSLIPMLDRLIEDCGRHRIGEMIMGMAHRGRLNVLVNIFGKSPQELFEEFEGVPKPGFGSGDVKYHKGFSSDLVTPHGTVHAVLAFNPSHLEVINPVVEGSVRARQERRRDRSRNQVLPVLLHGDAAFAGQGVVMETLNLSQTRGYTTGGTVHIVINNQIGFTTSDPLDSRSTLYCTDVAKMVQAPIFHVNGDDPEACVFIMQLALDYRMTFNRDVVVDLVCYRRHGHNEADEPSVTQPIMYRKIRQHPDVRDLYAERVVGEGVVEPDLVERLRAAYLKRLERGEPVCGRPLDPNPDRRFAVDYRPYIGKHWREPAETAIDLDRVCRLTEAMVRVPPHFEVHPKVQRILEERAAMGRGEMPMDWGYAETLAYASLLEDGYLVRLSGQDSVRGTFFHRHAGIHDQKTGEVWIPLRHLFEGQPEFLPINSLLSELAVLGFEVGYATAEPLGLIIWEAQFGDFANNAQVIIDQFISSSEAKWQRYCGITLFLPHGHEGQGPEHSSARLERFLQLCAEDNMQVCVPSMPAQMFHMLRRQMLRPYRKPLVVMTPKSLLRHRLSTSVLEEITEGAFRVVMDEIDPLDAQRVKRIIFCAGKVYFDLLEKRREHHLTDVAIVRIEQLYPFPREEVREILARYPNAREVVWAQEEPRNQGAWYYMQSRRTLKGCLSEHHRLEYAGRRYFAAPAVGYLQKHREQQRALVAEALRLDQEAADTQVRAASG